jgi:hypothetical protein
MTTKAVAPAAAAGAAMAWADTRNNRAAGAAQAGVMMSHGPT